MYPAMPNTQSTFISLSPLHLCAIRLQYCRLRPKASKPHRHAVRARALRDLIINNTCTHRHIAEVLTAPGLSLQHGCIDGSGDHPIGEDGKLPAGYHTPKSRVSDAVFCWRSRTSIRRSGPGCCGSLPSCCSFRAAFALAVSADLWILG